MKNRKLNAYGFAHHLLIAIVVVGSALVGTYYVVVSNANTCASPTGDATDQASSTCATTYPAPDVKIAETTKSSFTATYTFASARPYSIVTSEYKKADAGDYIVASTSTYEQQDPTKSALVSGLVPGTKYQFRVGYYDTADSNTRVYTSPIDVTTATVETYAAPQLKLVSVTGNTVKYSWSAKTIRPEASFLLQTTTSGKFSSDMTGTKAYKTLSGTDSVTFKANEKIAIRFAYYSDENGTVAYSNTLNTETKNTLLSSLSCKITALPKSINKNDALKINVAITNAGPVDFTGNAYTALWFEQYRTSQNRAGDTLVRNVDLPGTIKAGKSVSISKSVSLKDFDRTDSRINFIKPTATVKVGKDGQRCSNNLTSSIKVNY